MTEKEILAWVQEQVEKFESKRDEQKPKSKNWTKYDIMFRTYRNVRHHIQLTNHMKQFNKENK